MKKLIVAILSGILLLGSFAGCAPTQKTVEENLGIKSIADLNEYSEWFHDDSNAPVIIGIDPGAGIMAAAARAVEDYDLDFTLIASSEAAMIATLETAIQNRQAVVITGWAPHWKFANEDWGLKFLDDPKGSFGQEERIDIYSRLNFERDHPEINKFFANMSFSEAQMASLMGAVQSSNAGGSQQKITAAVTGWAEANLDLINEWFDGVGSFEGETVSIVYVNWAEGVAMTHLAAYLLSERGAQTNINMADIGPVFASLADGDSDIFMDTWLPFTHENYLDGYGDKITQVSTVFVGAKIGMVVPSYVYDDPVA